MRLARALLAPVLLAVAWALLAPAGAQAAPQRLGVTANVPACTPATTTIGPSAALAYLYRRCNAAVGSGQWAVGSGQPEGAGGDGLAATRTGAQPGGARLCAPTFCRLPAAGCLLDASMRATAGLLTLVSGIMDTRVIPPASLQCVLPAPIAHTTVRPSAVRQAAAAPARAHKATPGHASTSSAALHLPAYAPLGVQLSNTTNNSSYLMLGIKFALVLALLLVCLRVLRAVMPRLSGRVRTPKNAVVLHTEPVGAKQSVQVLDLGVRVLLIGVSGTSIAPLATVEDAEEIAALRERFGQAPAAHPVHARGDATGFRGIGPAIHYHNVQSHPARGSDEEARPSFAQALALATVSRTKGRSTGTADKEARARTSSEAAGRSGAKWTNRGRGGVRNGARGGDLIVGRALGAVRDLRVRAERL